MRSQELTLALTAIANLLAEGLSEGEIALLAGIFVQLGDTLATIGANRSLLGEKTEGAEE